jgi:hypothetical protein
VCANVIQLQAVQKEKSLWKTRLIVISKNVRRSEVNHNNWLISSSNPKTSKRFYYVKREEGLDCLVCDFKAFEISTPILCKHIHSYAMFEGPNT